MYGAEYVWILQEPQLALWNITNDCNKNNIKKAKEGVILVSNYDVIVDNVTSISGLVS